MTITPRPFPARIIMAVCSAPAVHDRYKLAT
jgi:hypothetical protein